MLVGGDCSIVLGALLGTKRAVDAPVGLVYVDAHADFATPQESQTGSVASTRRNRPTVTRHSRYRRSVRRSCLVLDVGLPGMSGPDLQLELTRRGPMFTQIVARGARAGEHAV